MDRRDEDPKLSWNGLLSKACLRNSFFNLPGIKVKNCFESICYCSFHQSELFPLSLKILTIRTLTRCVLTLRVPVVEAIRSMTPIHTSHQAPLFNHTEMQWPLAYHSKTRFVLDLNVVSDFDRK